MEKKIYKLLNELGVPFGCVGRDYIERAVEIIREKGRVAITKDLYPAIAKQFCATSSAVERGIRHAIERAQDNLGNEFIKQVFGNTISLKSGKLTNSDFIYGVVKYLEIHNKENSNE